MYDDVGVTVGNYSLYKIRKGYYYFHTEELCVEMCMVMNGKGIEVFKCRISDNSGKEKKIKLDMIIDYEDVKFVREYVKRN